MSIDEGNLGLAIGLSIASGLATSVGGLAVFCDKITTQSQAKILSSALSLSAGVMLYVSFVEIFTKARGALEETMAEGTALGITTLCFFVGMGIAAGLEVAVHSLMHCAGGSHSHDLPATPDAELSQVRVETGLYHDHVQSTEISEEEKKRLHSTALLTALAIAIHNFPEGLATFIASLAEPALGISLAVAIAVHNVPEGMAVAMPVYYSSGSKLKALVWATASGVSEPIGGCIGWLILRSHLDNVGFGIVFAMVGGMMVFIVIHEMLPVAVRYEPRQTHVTGFFVLGMIVMALSIVLFAL